MARKSRKNINEITVSTGMKKYPSRTEKKSTELSTAAYVRLSVENNGHESDDSIKTQLALVESFIEEHDELFLKDVYIDNGFTGTRFDRPEFVRMMDDVKTGKIQCIVVKDLSRFGRDYLETGYYLETIFPLLNVRFIAITDNYDSTRPEDRNSLSIPIKNMVNTMYAKDYSRKQEVFREMCIRTERVMAIHAPYGYKFDYDMENLVIDEEVEPYVRMIFAWTLAGVKRLEISRRLNKMGIPSPGRMEDPEANEKWSSCSVTYILYNPAYAGFHVMGKTKQSLYKGIPNHRKNRKEWIFLPDFHEPYITIDDYEKIEEMISENKRAMDERLQKRRELREQLPDCFSGKIFCKECNRQLNFLRGSHHRGYEYTFSFYRCRSSVKEAKCSRIQYPENYIKMVVMDQIKNLINLACDKERLIRKTKINLSGKQNHIERNIKRLMDNEKNIEDKLTRAYVDFVENLLDEDEYFLIKKKLSDDKRIASEKIDVLKAKLIDMENAVEVYEKQTEQLEKYLNVQEIDANIVDALIEKIWISDDRSIEIIFKCKDIFENPLIDEYLNENMR